MPSSKQYGARYGSKPKKKMQNIFDLKKNSTKCPYCMKNSVKRLSAGIWYCASCNTKFTGGAYTFNAKDYKRNVKESDFLKPSKAEKEEQTVEGFDEKQEVGF